jgi:hypothetical protein
LNEDDEEEELKRDEEEHEDIYSDDVIIVRSALKHRACVSTPPTCYNMAQLRGDPDI